MPTFYIDTGSITNATLTGSLFGTSSWATNALTASNGGVTAITAGNGISILPTTGTGNVTIINTAGLTKGQIVALSSGLSNLF